VDDKTREMDAPAEAMSATDDPLVGSLIDRKYLVEGLIGRGGMGRVYRGRNIRTESPVAIKTLIPELVTDESLVKRFEIEAKAASNLRHPNTIRIYDFGQEGDLLFMVMELLDGQPLEALVREGRVEPARVIRILKQTCAALAEAHAVGLVHRDLKPDNIFLNRVGGEPEFVKVLDFGVAKLRDKRFGNATLTQAGMIFGTPRYMSPEQARAQEIDQRSDIYALGVILYEALTGLPPFDAGDPVAVLVQHVQEPPRPFAEIAPDLAPMPALEAVVMRCLAKSADDRYDTVAQLVAALDAAVEAPGMGASASSAAPAASTMAVQSGPAETSAMKPPETPNPAAFDRLGIDSAAGVSTYDLGRSTLHVEPGAPPDRGRSPMMAVGIAVLLGVIGAGVAFAVIGGRDEGPPPPPESEPEVADPTTDPQTPPVPEASTEVEAAHVAAVDEAEARVANLEVTIAGGVEAMVAIAGHEPAPAPATFAIAWDPDAPSAIEVTATANGHEPATQSVTIDGASPTVELALQPVAAAQPDSPPRRDPPEHRPDPQPAGRDTGTTPPATVDTGPGLADPYANP